MSTSNSNDNNGHDNARNSIKQRQQVKRHERVEAVLELKANLDQAFDQLVSDNATAKAVQARIQTRERGEFDQLLRQGQNPYEIFRQKRMTRKASRDRAQAYHRIKTSELSIQERLSRENERTRVRKAHDRVHEEYVEAYQQALGRQYKEDQTEAYMLSRTGQALVDPTGREYTLEPSQVTVIKDHSFGLAKSSNKNIQQRDRMINLVANEHQNVTLDRRFLPTFDSMSGSSKSKSKSNPYPIQQRSALEEQYRNQALERQKANVFSKQIVWGKEFQGRPFLSSPEQIWFKDFTVNEPMRLSFKLTNVSHTFNHFKLLALPDRIKDDFSLSYEKPGRMSAGMTCSLVIEFFPRRNCDMREEILFHAKTGPFSVPLICTRKQVVPKLSLSKIHFDQIVLGEVATRRVRIRNEGALCASIKIIEVELTADDDDMSDSEEQDTTSNKSNSNSSKTGKIDPSSHDADVTTSTQSHEELMIQHAMNYYTNYPKPTSTNSNDKNKLKSKSKSTRDRNTRSSTSTSPEENIPSITSVIHGDLKGYETTSVTFTYAPVQVETLVKRYHVTFRTTATEHAEAETITFPIQLSATATAVPIYVENRLLDFHCCVVDKLYRSRIVLRNRGKVALKCQVHTPVELRDCIEFLPDFGFVQGRSSNNNNHNRDNVGDVEPSSNAGRFEIQLKFRPQAAALSAMLAAGSPFIQSKSDPDMLDTQGSHYILVLPVLIQVSGQILPVSFVLRAQITSARLRFSHLNIDFGTCPLNEGRTQTLSVRNESLLAQKFGFVHLDSQVVQVRPKERGFGTLLPGESREIELVFRPTACVTYDTVCVCRTSVLGPDYRIKCRGSGINLSTTAPVLSANHVCLGASSFGSSVVHSIFIRNATRVDQRVEFAIPKALERELMVRPRVIPVLKSGDDTTGVRIELEYRPALALDYSSDDMGTKTSPPITVEDSEESHAGSGSPTATHDESTRGLDVEDSEESWARALIETSVSRRTTLKLVNVDRYLPPTTGEEEVVRDQSSSWKKEEEEKEEEGASPEDPSRHMTMRIPCYSSPVESEERSEERTTSSISFLQISTIQIQPPVVAEPSRIAFEQIAVGRQKVLRLQLSNQSDDVLDMKSKPFNVAGPFSILNALRPMASHGGRQNLMIQFQPTSQAHYHENLIFTTSLGTVIEIPVTGEGVSPTLRVEPSDGQLAFAPVLVCEQSTRTLELHNSSDFPLQYEIISRTTATNGAGTGAHEQYRNLNNRSTFYCIPREGQIPPRACHTIEATFAPDEGRPMLEYCETFDILVPNQKEHHQVNFTGRCFDRQLYLFPVQDRPNPHEAIEDCFRFPSYFRKSDSSSSSSRRRLEVQFEIQSPNIKHLTIGCLKLNPGSGSSSSGGTFEFEIINDDASSESAWHPYFTLHPMKGTLSPGQEIQLALEYQPARASPEEQGEATKEEEKDAAAASESLSIGQWIEVSWLGRLKGGYVPASLHPEEQIQLTARAYFQLY